MADEKKDREIEVTKLTVKIGGREIELTPSEAETLRERLGKLLGKPDGYGCIHVTITYPQFYPHIHTTPYYQPNWIYSTGGLTSGSSTLGNFALGSQAISGSNQLAGGNLADAT